MAIIFIIQTHLIACALSAAFLSTTADAFSVNAIAGFTPRRCQSRMLSSNIPIDFSSSASPDADNSMCKFEAAGVQRFTKGYDKLCKSCPTRIQPRVDTLTEMIMGLPDQERDELMQNVARRLSEAQNNQDVEGKVTSSRDVYAFQTSGVVENPEKQKMNREKSYSSPTPVLSNIQQENDKASTKLSKKIDKTRRKFESNKQNSARASHLLIVTNALLSRNSDVKETASLAISNSVENGLYHDEMNRLKQLNRAELKMEMLKLTAKKAKHEQKIAKQRMKLFIASGALADVRTREKTQQHMP